MLIQELAKHQRKVGQVQWHPVAANVLASCGFDHMVVIWNVENAEALFTLDVHGDAVFCMSWNYDGSLLATTCKDKKIRVIDPRSEVVVSVSGIVDAENNCWYLSSYMCRRRWVILGTSHLVWCSVEG